jgi:hypothetical protein
MADTDSYIINIDSRFRVDPENSLSTDFVINLPSPIRNVKSVKLSTIEIPNVFYAFNNDASTILQVRPSPDPSGSGPYTHQEWETIIINPGNYDANTLKNILQRDIGRALGFAQAEALTSNQGFIFSISPSTGHSTLSINRSSSEFSAGSTKAFDINLSPVDFNLVYDYVSNEGAFNSISNQDLYMQEIDIYSQALQYYSSSLQIGDINMRDILGFADFLLYSKDTYTSTGFINTTGYQYLLLDVNGYETVTHISQDNEFKVFAKVPMTVAKSFISIGSVSRTIALSKKFERPENIAQFRIRLTDILGNVVDLKRQDIAITFEIEFYKTQTAYDKARNTLLKDGELTSITSDGSATDLQKSGKERLRNIVFNV